MDDDKPADMRDKPYLAAEIQGTKINMALPDDPMVARLLLEHLRHSIEIREIGKAMELQQKMRQTHAENGKRIQPATLDSLRGLRRNN